MKFELVSFSLCPYVQRSVITLKYKGVPFEIKYIDLDNPPEWFNKISPMGKVPLLIVDGKTTLFESAVINEFIDEVSGEVGGNASAGAGGAAGAGKKLLMSREPLQKALERAWIEFGSDLMSTQYRLFMAEDQDAVDDHKKELFEDLQHLEKILALSGGPFFRGKDFGLVDTAYAPLFMRMFFSDKLRNDPAWKSLPRTRVWAEALLELPAVKTSVTDDFVEKYTAYLKEAGSLLV